MLNRRSFFQAAGAATVAATIPAAKAADKTPVASTVAENVAKTFKGGVIAGPKIYPSPDLSLSTTFNPGKSILNDGVVMNASHWGVYQVHVAGGRIVRVQPIEGDHAPSYQLQAVAQQPYNGARIRYPMVRKSYLEKGYKAGGKKRGVDPYVRVSWDKALDLVASELKRVKETYGVGAIWGGSYGWMSTSNLGNARNLLQRVLNLNGGYTIYYGDYSTGCAQVMLPYVIGSNGVYEQVTGWDLIT